MNGKNKKDISQKDILIEFYKKNSGREISHPEVVDWVTTEYKKLTGKVFRDPDRQIRQLAQSGFLIKIKKGIYKYDKDFVKNRELEAFSAQQKTEILNKYNFKCVVCGRGPKEGVELHIDHIKPKELGGEATIDNGQVLCAQHNFQKKTYGQVAFGKRMFTELLDKAIVSKDDNMEKFCCDILKLYYKYKID